MELGGVKGSPAQRSDAYTPQLRLNRRVAAYSPKYRGYKSRIKKNRSGVWVADLFVNCWESWNNSNLGFSWILSIRILLVVKKYLVAVWKTILLGFSVLKFCYIATFLLQVILSFSVWFSINSIFEIYSISLCKLHRAILKSKMIDCTRLTLKCDREQMMRI